MRIGIEAQRLFRKKKHGMDVVAFELIKGLQKLSGEYEYIIFTKKGQDPCIQSNNNVTIVETSYYPYPIWEQIILPQLVKKHKIDLLHCTSNTAPLYVSIPLILTLHDIIFFNKESRFWNGGTLYQTIGNYYRRWNIPKILPMCRQIITVSDYSKETIAEYFPSVEERVKKIYNGVNKKFKQNPEPKQLVEVVERYNLPKNFILFLGNTAPKKNLLGVIKAYIHHTSLAFKQKNPLLITDIKNNFLAKVLKQVGGKGHEYIISTGYISQEDIVLFYHQSSLFLYPSFIESFGLPIIEAMATNTPVITGNTSSMVEIGGEAALFIDPNDSKALGKAMEDVIRLKALQETMIKLGVKRAADFSFCEMTKQVLSLYDDVLAKK